MQNDVSSEFTRLVAGLTDTSPIEAFRREIEAFRQHPLIEPHLNDDIIDLTALPLRDIALIAKNRSTTAGYYFLLGATTLNRTTIKAQRKNAIKVGVAKQYLLAHVLKESFIAMKFSSVVERAVSDRSRTLGRASSGRFEELFRDLLTSKGVGVVMSTKGHVVTVPGLLIKGRKPDGAYPDPRTGAAPQIYLEVKNVKRVSDDIQKRLYEIAQVSLEMKTLYGSLEFKGMNATPDDVKRDTSAYRVQMRRAITATLPVVVGLLMCSKKEAEPYREGIEAFVDRVFFAPDETLDCVEFLKATIEQLNNK